MSPPGSVTQGKEVRDGADIAAEIINNAGGALGSRLELLYEDTSGVPEKGRSAVEKLITSDGVVAIAGEHASSVTLANIDVANRYGIPVVNTNAWTDAVRLKGYDNVVNPSNWNSKVAEAQPDIIAAVGAKNVVALAENTDYGIGQAEALKGFLERKDPSIRYSSKVLDRAGRDFSPTMLELRRERPDMVVPILLPPTAYLVLNQLNEQGIAPTPSTMIFDGAAIADNPDFWDNVGDAGRYLLAFGLYHPKMNLPPFGQSVRDEYKRRNGREPSRLILQSADSILLVSEAVKKAGTTEKTALVKALQDSQVEGTRGVITFSKEPGVLFQQWVDIPYVIFQITERNQPPEETELIVGPGQPLDPAKIQKPR